MQIIYSMLNEKGSTLIFIVIGLIVLIAALGGAYFFGKSQVAQPQDSAITMQPPPPMATSSSMQPPPPIAIPSAPSDENTNFKTFNSKGFTGFSLIYPEKMKIFENKWVGNSERDNVLHIESDKGGMMISYQDVKTYEELCGGGNSRLNSQVKDYSVNIGGEIVKSQITQTQEGGAVTCKPIVLNGYNFVIDANDQDTLSTFEQILSTVKFPN